MRADQIEEVLRLDQQIFGFLPAAFDLSKLIDIEPIVGPVCWVRTYKDSLRGFVVFLPLNQRMRLQASSGAAKGLGDLDFSEFRDPDVPVVGIFGEAVAALKNCPVRTRVYCAKFSADVVKAFCDIDIFATPVTQDGMDFQRRLGFAPLQKDALHQVFWRPGAACTQCAAE